MIYIREAVIGSRREEASIVVKKGVRNLRGKLFIYLWKRLIPNLNYVVDTQCGFKAFAEFIETLDETGWNRLVENIPAAIADADPVTFGDLNEVQVADLRAVVD